jgi:hypothetical protein
LFGPYPGGYASGYRPTYEANVWDVNGKRYEAVGLGPTPAAALLALRDSLDADGALVIAQGVSDWKPPMPLDKALPLIRAALPTPCPPWVFSDLSCETSLDDDEPVTIWAIRWQHTDTGAGGWCAAPTAEGLIEHIRYAVEQVLRREESVA